MINYQRFIEIYGTNENECKDIFTYWKRYMQYTTKAKCSGYTQEEVLAAEMTSKSFLEQFIKKFLYLNIIAKQTGEPILTEFVNAKDLEACKKLIQEFTYSMV